jgi:hypothetical protein
VGYPLLSLTQIRFHQKNKFTRLLCSKKHYFSIELKLLIAQNLLNNITPMKKIIIAVVSLLSFSMYSQSRYELQDTGKERLYLSDTIIQMAANKVITNEPMLIVDGITYTYQDLEKKKLALSKNQILKIVPVDKQKAISDYGDTEGVGVLILTTLNASN